MYCELGREVTNSTTKYSMKGSYLKCNGIKRVVFCYL